MPPIRWVGSASTTERPFLAAARALRALDELERVGWSLVDAPDSTAGEGIKHVLSVHDRRMKLLASIQKGSAVVC
jgi:hypothetical protein